MPRLKRFTPSGYGYHVIQRGNNRQVIFCDEEDFACYVHWPGCGWLVFSE